MRVSYGVVHRTYRNDVYRISLTLGSKRRNIFAKVKKSPRGAAGRSEGHSLRALNVGRFAPDAKVAGPTIRGAEAAGVCA